MSIALHSLWSGPNRPSARPLRTQDGISDPSAPCERASGPILTPTRVFCACAPCASLHLPQRRVDWSLFYRKVHRKDITELIVKRRTRRNVKHSRSIAGMSVADMAAKRTETADVRQAKRDAGAKLIKERKAARMAAAKVKRAAAKKEEKSAGKGGNKSAGAAKQQKGNASKGGKARK